MIRRILILAVILSLPLPNAGCAALVVGYLVGDAIQRDKATETCRANLRITNEDRARRGLDLFPDTCR